MSLIYYVLNSNICIKFYENYYYKNSKFTSIQDKKLYFYIILKFLTVNIYIFLLIIIDLFSYISGNYK